MITLFDIPFTLPNKAWSPNVWKTRFPLNYKKIPYTTKWMEYPDIAPTSIHHGISPNDIQPDGSVYYTVPAIIDASNGTALADSFAIAKYLDNAYPDTPQLIPEGTEALIASFFPALSSALTPMRRIILPAVTPKLNPTSQDYYSKARAGAFGKQTLDEVVPSPEERGEVWKKVEEGFCEIDSWLKETDGKGPWVMGDKVTFVDFVIGGYFIWYKLIFGEESEEWKDIKRWNGGRWENFLKALEVYSEVT